MLSEQSLFASRGSHYRNCSMSLASTVFTTLENGFTSFNSWTQFCFLLASNTFPPKPYIYFVILKSGGVSSPSIFYCKTLVVHRLQSISILSMVGFSIDLPLLKILVLCNIIFYTLDDLMKLLYGCPKLEDLSTINVMGKAGGIYGYIWLYVDERLWAFNSYWHCWAMSNSNRINVLEIHFKLFKRCKKINFCFSNILDLIE